MNTDKDYEAFRASIKTNKVTSSPNCNRCGDTGYIYNEDGEFPCDGYFCNETARVFRLKAGDIVEQNGHYYDVVPTGRKGEKLAMRLITDGDRLSQLDSIDEALGFNADMRLNLEVM